jgi:hypothetical protein
MPSGDKVCSLASMRSSVPQRRGRFTGRPLPRKMIGVYHRRPQNCPPITRCGTIAESEQR